MNLSSSDFYANFPRTIFVLGVGGTGARITDELRFFLKTAASVNRNILRETKIILIDHDLVEEKNCLRQPFQHGHLGLPKSYVKAQYLMPFCRVRHIPEPLNQSSIPLVFTPEKINNNFLVISAMDNLVTRAMVYHYLLENATQDKDKTWYWIFTGGDLKPQKIVEAKTVLGAEDTTQYEIPYVTNLGWGYYRGTPTITPAPHIRFPEEFPKVEGFGMNYENLIVGCGLAPEDRIKQSYTMNNMASVLTMFMLDRFYFDGLIIPQITFTNGQTDTVYAGSLKDLDKKVTEDLISQIVNEAEITENVES